MQIDANKLRQVLRERHNAALDQATEALKRATAIQRDQTQDMNDAEFAASQAAVQEALRESARASAREDGLWEAIKVLNEMTRPCDQCGCSPAACGCVDNGEG